MGEGPWWYQQEGWGQSENIGSERRWSQMPTGQITKPPSLSFTVKGACPSSAPAPPPPHALRFVQVIFSSLQETLQMQFAKVDPAGLTDELCTPTLCVMFPYEVSYSSLLYETMDSSTGIQSTKMCLYWTRMGFSLLVFPRQCCCTWCVHFTRY